MPASTNFKAEDVRQVTHLEGGSSPSVELGDLSLLRGSITAEWSRIFEVGSVPGNEEVCGRIDLNQGARLG